VSDVRPLGLATVPGRYVNVFSRIPPMLSLPAHGNILICTWIYMSYKESYCLCLLLSICEERRKMFLSYVGTHVPDYTVSKPGSHKKKFFMYLKTLILCTKNRVGLFYTYVFYSKITQRQKNIIIIIGEIQIINVWFCVREELYLME
jgi:hypothetical protein